MHETLPNFCIWKFGRLAVIRYFPEGSAVKSSGTPPDMKEFPNCVQYVSGIPHL